MLHVKNLVSLLDLLLTHLLDTVFDLIELLLSAFNLLTQLLWTIELLAVSSAKAVFASLSDKHCARLLLWLIYLDYYAHVLPAKAFE